MIYIQKHNTLPIPHHYDAACAMYGAIETGQDFYFAHYDDVCRGACNNLVRHHLFVGSVEFMMEVWKKAGLAEYPRVPENSNRESEKITLGEAKARAQAGEKLFVKPQWVKLFTGFVLDGSQYSCIKDLPDDTPVLAYQPFKSRVESEWRVYVHHHVPIDARNYAGDFEITPDWQYIKSVAWRNSERFPAAYTIDIGILETGQNVVIEYNDMWAIGNYGLPNDVYLRMLADRYWEVMRSSKKMVIVPKQEEFMAVPELQKRSRLWRGKCPECPKCGCTRTDTDDFEMWWCTQCENRFEKISPYE